MTGSPQQISSLQQPFVLASEYDVPPTPTEHAVKQILRKLRARVSNTISDSGSPQEQLCDIDVDFLDRISPPPAYGFFLDEISLSLKDWLDRDNPPDLRRVVTLPPGDSPSVMKTWAEGFGFQILKPPKRASLLDATTKPPSLEGKGILVIPRLEDWFIRHKDGLRVIRDLLQAMHWSDRKIIIGCNDWAWSYLTKSVSAHHLLPAPITFKSYDHERLEAWISEMSAPVRKTGITFRFHKNSEDMFKSPKERGTYFKTLAGASRGIPWTAWELWRSNLSLSRDSQKAPKDEDTTDEYAEQKVVWVSELEAFSLPGNDSDLSLLVLHAILLHGAISSDNLKSVLPKFGVENTLPLLLGAGLIKRVGEKYFAAPAAYPSVRLGLKTAGFPLNGQS